MSGRIPLDPSCVAIDPDADRRRGDGTHEVAADVAYLRCLFVNVVFLGETGAGDRGFVLVDAGYMGSEQKIRHAAERRFGAGARAAAIVLTHAHFDHVGVLETLARDWDTPVLAHPLERPHLDGTRAYPRADPLAGGGAMALLSPLYPRAPVDVSQRLSDLPDDSAAIPHLPDFRAIPTPGHTEGHVSLWRERDGLLIAGDAVVTCRQESAYEALLAQDPEMHGPPRYLTSDWDAARSSMRRLAELSPQAIVAGHGPALHGGAMRAALRRLADEFDTIARPSRR